jgi:hypothetical protein
MHTRRRFCVLLGSAAVALRTELLHGEKPAEAAESSWNLDKGFDSLPDATRPYVLWMWMGSNVSKSGITSDLEAMREAGIGGATIYSLADTLTPWAGEILKSPTPEIIAFTNPWWEMLRHAALEAQRLGLELLLHNCAGYESSGGTWITPELSMQELAWSELQVAGGSRVTPVLKHPVVDLTPGNPFPEVYIPKLKAFGVPKVEAKQTYFKDVAVVGILNGDSTKDPVRKDVILDLSEKMDVDGKLDWDAPKGNWTIYRFGHTTTGAMIQPAQWGAMGLECDKMSKAAVTFHVNHVLTAMKQHLGDLVGNPITTLYFDSYEAGIPTWTPKMQEEFETRRGYALTPWLPALAGRTVGSEAETAHFRADFHRTIEDLYRDCYWATPGPLAHAAGLKFVAEPYEGPWKISEVVGFLDIPTAEFWTTNNRFSPSDLAPVVSAAHELGDRVIAAESFTSPPATSGWTAHPAWLKPIGDAAFCAGINRINVHNFVQQPWDDRYQPGNAMGQWGTHLGRYQTWWKPGKAWITYLWRCQTLLQMGDFVAPSEKTSARFEIPDRQLALQSIHRRTAQADVYFVANTGLDSGVAQCSFPVRGKQPELWDPVTGVTNTPVHYEQNDNSLTLSMEFAAAQSWFVIFRNSPAKHQASMRIAPARKLLTALSGNWNVRFDPRWGGPASVAFDQLVDWTSRAEEGIRHYSGTAHYSMTADLPSIPRGQRIYLDLGIVKHIAEVTLNNKIQGVVWTAPWIIDVTESARSGENLLEIAVTNVWANRLIGDEQQPADIIWERGDPKMNGGSFLKEFPDWFLGGEKRPSNGRRTFTTWNYFKKDTPLEPSGLMGPVRFMSLTHEA